MERNQYETELHYSKKQAKSLILEDLGRALPTQMYMDMHQAIDKFKHQSYYDSKNVRIRKLKDTSEIVHSIFYNILKTTRQRPIQDPATAIGFEVGMDNPVDAVKTGAELLAVTADTELFDIIFYKDGTEVKPKLCVEEDTRKRLDSLQFLPPCKEIPQDWLNNHVGGWLYENKSVLLGKGNHHNHKQGLDALNKLQQVGWTIDPEVLLNEVNSNTAMDQDQFITIASEYIGQEFYFVWRFDKRGRSYSSGYDLNIQSNEYGKALLSLAKKEPITGLNFLKIAIAGHYGLDRLTWKERIDWFDAQNDTFDTSEADEPILARKALRAYQDALDGKESGYVMSLDATASGLQVMAALTGCKKTAKAVNMVDPTQRMDIYTQVADSMADILNEPVPRALVKKPVMTHYYNSEANPAGTFNPAQLDAFYAVLDDLLEGAEAMMETVNSFWNYNGDCHMWTLPDGHVAKVNVVEMADTRVEIDELNHRTFTYRYAKKQPSKNFRSLVANIVHSVDGYVAREMVRRANFQLVHIHDCFVFSPDHFTQVQELYKQIMAEIADSNLLSDILSELKGSYVKVTKLSNDLSQDILKSDYMLS